MQLLNLTIILTIAFILTNIFCKQLLNNVSFKSTFIKRLIKIVSFFVLASIFAYGSTFLPLGSVTYGQRQAKHLYLSKKSDIDFTVQLFEQLNKNHLWSITKNIDGIELLVGDKSFDCSDKNQNGLNKALIKHGIDKIQLDILLAAFEKSDFKSISSSGGNFLLLAIKEVFPIQMAYLVFCPPVRQDCIQYPQYKKIDEGVYFVTYSNP